jgi:hypothetical protein
MSGGQVFGKVVSGDPTLAADQLYTITLTADGRLRVDTGGGGGATIVEGDVTLSDATANPTDAIPAGAFVLAFDRAAGNWERVDRFNLTAGIVGTGFASSGAALKTAAHLVGCDSAGSQWIPVRANGSGWLYVYPQGAYTIGDGRAVLGQGEGISTTWAFLGHRSQANNAWNASRGGYSSAIGAADIASILNAISTLAYNSSAPAVVSSQAVAAQSDSRGSHLVQIAKPDNTARDTPSVSFNAGSRTVSAKAAAGNLLSVSAGLAEKGEVAVYLLFVDRAVAPADGDVPVWAEFMPPITGDEGASSFYEPVRIGRETFSQQGIRFSNGIGICFSSTPNVVTLIPATANCVIAATYV